MAQQIEVLAAKTGSLNSIPQSHKLACHLHRKAWCRLTLPHTYTQPPPHMLIIIVIIILFVEAIFNILKKHKTKNIGCFPFKSNLKAMKESGHCTQENLKDSLAHSVGVSFTHKVIRMYSLIQVLCIKRISIHTDWIVNRHKSVKRASEFCLFSPNVR